MPKKPPPLDINQLAKLILDTSTGQVQPGTDVRSEMARSLGRRGGLKGGPARSAKLSQKRIDEIASNAAKARWKKYRAAKLAAKRKEAKRAKA